MMRAPSQPPSVAVRGLPCVRRCGSAFPRWLALALAAAWFAVPAMAADKAPAQSSFGSGASGALLTREQLRACLAQQARVAQEGEALPKEQAALTATQDELERSATTLKAVFDALDMANADAVAQYNAQVQARTERIEAFQARTAGYNRRFEAAQVEREAFVKACGNRSYYDSDAAAIRSGK